MALAVACSPQPQPAIVMTIHDPCGEARSDRGRAVCDVRERLEDARRARDVVRVLCLHDKLAALVRLRDDDPWADETALQLRQEAAECIGGDAVGQEWSRMP